MKSWSGKNLTLSKYYRWSLLGQLFLIEFIVNRSIYSLSENVFWRWFTVDICILFHSNKKTHLVWTVNFETFWIFEPFVGPLLWYNVIYNRVVLSNKKVEFFRFMRLYEWMSAECVLFRSQFIGAFIGISIIFYAILIRIVS